MWAQGAGILAAFAVVALRQAQILDGVVALGFTLLVLVVVPTAGTLSGRIFLNGTIALSWVQLFWWLPAGGATPWRMTTALALCTGVAAASAVLHRRGAFPRVRWVDGVPPLIIGILLLLYRPLLAIKTAPVALAFMLGGWDNVAHFAMVRQILAYGATADVLPASEAGSRPAYASYPQGFHATLASFMELRSPSTMVQLESQLALYVQSSVLVVIGLAAVLVAGICTLPALRRRPSWALGLGVVAISALTLGPGQASLLEGFPNFLYACAMVALTAVSASRRGAIGRPVVVAAATGGVVGAAHSWILMAPLAAVAMLPMLDVTYLRRSRRSHLVASIAILLVGALASLRSIVIVSSVVAQDPFTLNGGISPPSLGAAIFVTAVLAVLGIVAWSGHQRGRHEVLGVLAVAVLATVMVGALIAYQITRIDMVSYYAMKMWTGVLIIAWALIPLPVALLLLRAPRGIAMSSAGLLLALGASQFNGYLGPSPGSQPQPQMGLSSLMTVQDGVDARVANNSAPARRIVSVALMQQDRPDQFYVLVEGPPENLPWGFLSNMWIRSLTLTWLQDTNATMLAGTPDVIDQGTSLAPYIRQVLDLDPPVTPVVSESDLAAAVDDLSRQEAERVAVLVVRPTTDLAQVKALTWPR